MRGGVYLVQKAAGSEGVQTIRLSTISRPPKCILSPAYAIGKPVLLRVFTEMIR